MRELVLGHNGLARLLPGRQLFGGRGQPVGGGPPGDAGGSPVGMRPPSGQAGGQARLAVPSGENEPGLLRLFRPMLATQVSWLLPLALIGVPLLAWQNWPLKWRRGGLEGPDAPSGSDALAGDRRRWQGLLLWGGWLLSTGGYFTVGNMFHAYYLVMLAPAVAALFGAGIVALWQERRRGRWGWLLLPAALGLTAAVQAGILAEYPDWRRWLVPLVGGLCAAAVIGLGAMRRAGRRAWIRRAGTALAAAGVLGLLVTPAVWSVYTAWNAPVGGLPSAGPPPIARSASGAQGTAPMVLSGAANAPRGDRPPVDPTSQVDPKLLEYLRSNLRTARFIFAVPSSVQSYVSN